MRAEVGGYSCSKLPRSVLAFHVTSHGGRRLCCGASPGGRDSSSCPSVLSCAFPPSPSPCTHHPLAPLVSGFSTGRGAWLQPRCSSMPGKVDGLEV